MRFFCGIFVLMFVVSAFAPVVVAQEWGPASIDLAISPPAFDPVPAHKALGASPKESPKTKAKAAKSKKQAARVKKKSHDAKASSKTASKAKAKKAAVHKKTKK